MKKVNGSGAHTQNGRASPQFAKVRGHSVVVRKEFTSQLKLSGARKPTTSAATKPRSNLSYPKSDIVMR